MFRFSIFTKIILIVFFALFVPLVFSNYFIIDTYQDSIDRYVSGIDSESIKAELIPLQKSAYAQNVIIFCLFLIIICIVFLVLSKVIIKPIRKLVDGTKGVAKGDFNTRVCLKTGDELEVLAESFNGMVKELEESFLKIEEERKKTSGIIFNFIDGILFFDGKKDLKIINPKAEEIFGVNGGKLIGKNIKDFRNEKYFSLVSILSGGGEIKKTVKRNLIFQKDEKELFFETSIIPISGESESFGYIVILHDTTREKAIEKLKSEFISLAAHQLLTPTSAVKWALDSISKGEVGKITKKQKNSLEKAIQNNERTIAVVDDLLNVTRIEEGRFVGEFTEESLGDLIKKAIDSRWEKIKAKMVKVDIAFSNGEDIRVEVNKQSLVLAVENLLDNAIEYNVPDGNVTIKISRDNMEARVEFNDTGIGILQTEQEKIFTKFFRGDNALKIKSSGTGLGLFIVRTIIEAHKGRVGFSSKENGGSSFWFTLPILNNK